MTLYDCLDRLGLEPDRIYAGNEKVLDAEIEIHSQPNYPLKGYLQNVRMLDGKVALASSASSEYGSSKAWEEGEDDGCLKCGFSGSMPSGVCPECGHDNDE